MKKVKPKVDKMTNQMQQNIESVSEKISKEIFDDEIYERANFEASYNEKDQTESGIDATGKSSVDRSVLVGHKRKVYGPKTECLNFFYAKTIRSLD